MTNNGTITFANTGNGVDLRLSGGVSFAGTGSLVLNDFANNRIFANAAGDRLTIGSGQTIEGAGNLGVGQTTLTNNGTVIANQSNALVHSTRRRQRGFYQRSRRDHRSDRWRDSTIQRRKVNQQ